MTSNSKGLGLWCLLMAGLGLLILQAQERTPDARPAGLAAVSPSSLGFVHIRVADLWHGETAQAIRRKLPRETAVLEQRLGKRWGVTPEEVESVTLVWPGSETPPGPVNLPPPLVKPAEPPPERARPEPAKPVRPGAVGVAVGYTFIFTTIRPYDRARIREAATPEAEQRSHKDRLYFVSKKFDGTSITFLTDRVFAWGSEEALKNLLEKRASPRAKGPLDEALRLASQRHHAAGGLDVAASAAGPMLGLYKLAITNSPDLKDFKPLLPLFEVKRLAFTLNIEAETEAVLRLHFDNEAQARAARKPAEVLMELVQREAAPLLTELGNERGVPNLVRVLKLAETALKTPVVEQRGAAVLITLRFKTPPALLTEAAAEGARLYAREVARTRSVDKLRKIGEAVEIYDNLHNHYPPAAIFAKDGKPLLSWRVAILPHLGEEELFKQFKLDEPWDSLHNVKLLSKMPPVYAPVQMESEAGDGAPSPQTPHVTYYRGFAGKGAFFGENQKLRYLDIKDGTEQTVMIVEAGEAVPWTKPDELTFDPDKPLPRLGGQFPEGFHALFCDGRTVHFLKRGTGDAALKALITINGGEKVDLQKLR